METILVIIDKAALQPPFNRTNLEWKLDLGRRDVYAPGAPFNRTNLEWKQILMCSDDSVFVNSFNRTNLEWKLSFHFHLLPQDFFF